LLSYYPRRYLDRSRITKIRSVHKGEQVTIVGKILSAEMRRGRKNRFVLLVGDGTGILQCVWFQGIRYISKVFESGETIAFSGKITVYRGPQLVHPEYDKIGEEGGSSFLNTGGIVPMYPSTDVLSGIGLDSRGFRRILREVLNRIAGTVPETLSETICTSHKLVSIAEALDNIHFPSDWEHFKRAQYRLKFEELFFIQLFLALQRSRTKTEQDGVAFERIGERTRTFLKNLPFNLTEAQKRVLREIREDMRSKKSMNRLLQGDVGSGKTVVAMVALLTAVENGYQAALMAPTEILAEQHYITLHGFFEDLGIQVTLLKGGKKASERLAILEKISKGEIDIVVGTHALVQKDVAFRKLGLVVIDEQHRFGVMQRAVLRQKGYHPDVLVMTATPIPRTLALTLYGDLDVSIIDELPEGRMEVRTVWRRASNREAIYSFFRDEIRRGGQVYIVYPLVEESEKMDLADATAGYESLSKGIFPEFRVALLHGRMKAEEKEALMKAFKSGEIHCLVATTVVEVGVDVPNATSILIEHAERFGLTQLHQLRGRVGRGKTQSTCILLTHGFLSEDAMKRIQAMVDTNDGFRIAETDLEIRGPGELFGTRQHGILNLKIANLVTDGPILEQARKTAFQLVDKDPDLNTQENQRIRRVFDARYRDRFQLMDIG
jgi:ATP-dependent DNA helicase RecG